MKIPCQLAGGDTGKRSSRLGSMTLSFRLVRGKMGTRKIPSWSPHRLCERVICLLQGSIRIECY